MILGDVPSSARRRFSQERKVVIVFTATFALELLVRAGLWSNCLTGIKSTNICSETAREVNGGKGEKISSGQKQLDRRGKTTAYIVYVSAWLMFTLWSNRDYIHGHKTKFGVYDKSCYAGLLVICDNINQVITDQ